MGRDGQCTNLSPTAGFTLAFQSCRQALASIHKKKTSKLRSIKEFVPDYPVIAQWFRVLAALAEDLSLVPRTLGVAHKHPELQF